MATIEQLQEKLAAAELKVEKCRKTIERHRAQMEKKGDALRKLGVDPETVDPYSLRDDREAYSLYCDYKWKKDDLKGAREKLDDAERIAKNWRYKLDLQINQEKIIQDTVPQVLRDFLEKWKVNAFAWYIKGHANFVEFKARLREEETEARLEAFNTLPEYAESRERRKKIYGENAVPGYSDLINVWPHKPMDEFLKERRLDYKSIKERLAAQSDGVILRMCEFRDEDARKVWLDQTLEAEKKAKLMDLFHRVTDVCGPIKDASGLRVDVSGDLGGVVVGEKGVASVQTIGAGGYNIQCYHYRTLVRDVAEKVKGKPALDSTIADARAQTETVKQGRDDKNIENNVR